MKSVIICEGNTDLTLIQYFLDRVYKWEYIDKNSYKNFDKQFIHPLKTNNSNDVKWFNHDRDNILCIVSSGGVSGIPDMLNQILDINNIGAAKPFDRIVVISDRDEANTEGDFILKLTKEFAKFDIEFHSEELHNRWSVAEYKDLIGNNHIVDFLPLIIPFEDTGAIETFLLDALSEASEVDKKVIEQCKDFIENIDCKDNDNTRKYLNHRRERTKAKFDTVFVVMTPAEAFRKRQNILRSVPWEQYETIQQGFKQLSILSEKNSG